MSTIPSDFNQSLLDLNPKNQRKRSICSSFKNCFSFLLTKRSSSTYENINNSFTKNTDENSKNTLDSFMNSTNKKKQIKINSHQPKIESYVPNELFILKGNRSGYAIFIKITEIKLGKKKVSPFITLDSAKKMLIENGIFIEESKNSKVINKLMKIPFIFSLETEKIHFSLNYILNTKFPKFEICEYISNRLKGNSILDCTGGIGEFTIPLAEKNYFSISVHHNNEILNNCKMNSEIMLKKTKLEFIKIDLNENLKNNEENKNKECNKKKNNLLDIFKNTNKINNIFIKRDNIIIDLVIWRPEFFLNEYNGKNINTSIIRNFFSSIAHTTKDFVIILDKNFENFDELIDLLYECLYYKEKGGIEIEKIYLNDKLKQIIIYYGNISNIKCSEEMKYIFTLIEGIEKNDEETEKSKNAFKCFINSISNSLGNMFLLNLVLKTIEDFESIKKKNKNSEIQNFYEYFKEFCKILKLKLDLACNDSHQHNYRKISSNILTSPSIPKKESISRSESKTIDDLKEESLILKKNESTKDELLMINKEKKFILSDIKKKKTGEPEFEEKEEIAFSEYSKGGEEYESEKQIDMNTYHNLKKKVLKTESQYFGTAESEKYNLHYARSLESDTIDLEK